MILILLEVVLALLRFVVQGILSQVTGCRAFYHVDQNVGGLPTPLVECVLNNLLVVPQKIDGDPNTRVARVGKISSLLLSNFLTGSRILSRA